MHPVFHIEKSSASLLSCGTAEVFCSLVVAFVGWWIGKRGIGTARADWRVKLRLVLTLRNLFKINFDKFIH